MASYTRGMSTNTTARPAHTDRPSAPTPYPLAHPAPSPTSLPADRLAHRILRALPLLLAALLGLNLLVGGYDGGGLTGRPLPRLENGLIAPIDGAPVQGYSDPTHPDPSDPLHIRYLDDPSDPRLLHPADDAPTDLLLPEDIVEMAPLPGSEAPHSHVLTWAPEAPAAA